MVDVVDVVDVALGAWYRALRRAIVSYTKSSNTGRASQERCAQGEEWQELWRIIVEWEEVGKKGKGADIFMTVS